MKSLDQVRDELMSRVIPDSFEEQKEYWGRVRKFSEVTETMDALLVAKIERTNFEGNPTPTMNWAVEESGHERGTIMRYLRIGRLLLDVDTPVFDILKQLSGDKVIYILTLPENDIPKFVLSRGKKLITLTRQAVIDDIHSILGKEPEESKKTKSNKYQPSLWDNIESLCEKDARDFQDAAMSDDFSQDKALKFAFSGLGLLTASTTYWKTKGAEDAQMLAAVESELRKEADALADVRNNITAKLQSAG